MLDLTGLLMPQNFKDCVIWYFACPSCSGDLKFTKSPNQCENPRFNPIRRVVSVNNSRFWNFIHDYVHSPTPSALNPHFRTKSSCQIHDEVFFGKKLFNVELSLENLFTQKILAFLAINFNRNI